MISSAGAIAEFKQRQQTKKSDHTAKNYDQCIRSLAEWLQNPGSAGYDPNKRNRDSKEIWEANTADLRIFLRNLLNNGGYAGGTVDNHVIAINVFYQEVNRMAEEGMDIPQIDNPAADLDVSGWSQLKKGTKKEQGLKQKQYHYLEPDEVESLADNVDSPSLRNELIIRLLYQTGLRRGELVNTRVVDVDTAERTISVRATKSHLNRTVRYQPSLDAIMNRWLDVNRPALSKPDSDYLFPTTHSDQIGEAYVGTIVGDAAENAGLQEVVFTDASGRERMKISAHTLRHSYAVQCLKNGMDIRTLKELMGHSQIETTEKYLRLSEDDVLDAARKFGAGTE